MRIKKYIHHGITNWSNSKFSKLTMRIIWQTVGRITIEILGVKGLENDLGTTVKGEIRCKSLLVVKGLRASRVHDHLLYFHNLTVGLIQQWYYWEKLDHGCGLAAPGGPWCLTFAHGRLKNFSFSIKSICCAPWIYFRTLGSLQFFLEHNLVDAHHFKRWWKCLQLKTLMKLTLIRTHHKIQIQFQKWFFFTKNLNPKTLINSAHIQNPNSWIAIFLA